MVFLICAGFLPRARRDGFLVLFLFTLSRALTPLRIALTCELGLFRDHSTLRHTLFAEVILQSDEMSLGSTSESENRRKFSADIVPAGLRFHALTTGCA